MRSGFLRSFFLFFSAAFFSTAFSKPLPALVQQPRTLAMGGAGVGLADDEYALFHNPAGLAGQETRRFRLLGIGVEASLDAYNSASTSSSAFRNFGVSTLNEVVGKDIFVRGNLVPMISLPHFSLAYIEDFQGSIQGYSLSNPSFNFGYMVTRGVQAGIGWTIAPGRRPKNEFRVGVAAKILWRQGGYFDVSTAGFMAAANDGKAYLKETVGNYGAGFGGDVGFQYVRHLDKSAQLSVGASATDFTTTRFSSPQAAAIEPNVSFGLGYKKKVSIFKVALAADLRHLTEDVTFSNKLHFGTELGIPFLNLYLGAYQLNPTWGFAFDLWIIKIGALSYAEQQGVYYNQALSRRYVAFFNLNLPI